jgi:chemotaxis protein CheX
MTIVRDELREITENIWVCLFGSLEGLEAREDHPPPETPAMEARVNITGRWEGAVSISCLPGFARMVAQRLYGDEQGGPVPATIVTDAVGELASLIGGNVKALLPGPTTLSMPSVCERAEVEGAEDGLSPMCAIAFAWGGEPFTISLRKSGA